MSGRARINQCFDEVGLFVGMEFVDDDRARIETFAPIGVGGQAHIARPAPLVEDRAPRVDHFEHLREPPRTPNRGGDRTIDEARLEPVNRRAAYKRPRLHVGQEKIEDKASHEATLAVFFADVDGRASVSPEALVIDPTEKRFEYVVLLPLHESHRLAGPLPARAHRDATLQESNDASRPVGIVVPAWHIFGPVVTRYPRGTRRGGLFLSWHS